jgi:hypothetical protein
MLGNSGRAAALNILIAACGLGPLCCGAARGDADQRLDFELKEVLNRGVGVSHSHLAEVEYRLRRSFQALPQNSLGRITPATARYLLQSHLMREHGWLLAGLEPNGMRRTDASGLHTINIIGVKAPSLKKALEEARPTDCGYSFEDVVVISAVLERLILDESRKMLETSYLLNNRTFNEVLKADSLMEILTSYLLLFRRGDAGVIVDPVRHAAQKKEKYSKPKGTKEPTANGWLSMPLLAEDAIQNFDYVHRKHENPFRPRLYSFKCATRIVEDIVRRYGKWQDDECRSMHNLLKGEGKETGRVALASFYKAGESFNEAPEYLQKIGALDETIEGEPMVILVNYLMGPNNCVADLGYFCTCCLNHCLTLMNELEATTHSSYASADDLLEFVANYSESMRPSARMTAKLRAIEALHGGRVPLHGRLFAQWLHVALPQICPYPRMIWDLSALTRSYFVHGGSRFKLNPMARLHYIRVGTSNPHRQDIQVANMLGQWWSDEESLPLGELPALPTTEPAGNPGPGSTGFAEYVGRLFPTGFLFGKS